VSRTSSGSKRKDVEKDSGRLARNVWRAHRPLGDEVEAYHRENTHHDDERILAPDRLQLAGKRDRRRRCGRSTPRERGRAGCRRFRRTRTSPGARTGSGSAAGRAALPARRTTRATAKSRSRCNVRSDNRPRWRAAARRSGARDTDGRDTSRPDHGSDRSRSSTPSRTGRSRPRARSR